MHEQLAWHRARLEDDDVPSHPDEPEVGWYKIRLVKGGPWVPARIWLEQNIDPASGELVADEELRAELNGNSADPYDQWIWLSARPISEQEFLYMEDLRRWAAWHAPDEPAANPRTPIDFQTVRPPVFASR
jgi:hypothetical protein